MFSPPDPRTYNQIIYAVVRQIPPGRASSYGQIASMIPPPAGVELPAYRRLSPRWVGTAMRNCPDDVPWFRVLNSRGTISLPAGSPAAHEQCARLEAEGVVFDENGRVDWAVAGWDGPDDKWLRARGLFPPRPLKKSKRG